MSVGETFEFAITGIWYVFLTFCALVVLGFAIGSSKFSLMVAKKWVQPLDVMPSVKYFLMGGVFLLMLPLGFILMFAAGKSSDEGGALQNNEGSSPQNKKTKKSPNRPVSGSIVADAMLFDGNPEKARMARKYRNMFD